jgi:hypothetical protein
MILSKRNIELEARILNIEDDPKVRASDILDTLFRDLNFQPYKKDSAGNIVHNAKGRATLDWANIAVSITRLIGKIIAIYYVRNNK